MLQELAAQPFGCIKSFHNTEINEYLADIFSEAKPADGAVCFMSIPKKNKKKANVSFMRASEASTRSAKEAARHDKRNLFFSFSTYREKKDSPITRRTNDITNIFAWSIDVDFTQDWLQPEMVYQYIIENVDIPTPNYIEYGHRLRLIYIFKEPLRLYAKQRESLLRGFAFLQKTMARKINQTIEGLGCEAVPPTSFFRMPGSINDKNDKIKYIIHVRHISSIRYTMQEVIDGWCFKEDIDPSGNADEWLEKWKVKKTQKKTNNISDRFNSYKLWERRMKVFEEIQNQPGIPREKLCFFYALGLLNTNQAKDYQTALPLLFEFNQKFQNPLSENEINSKFRNLKNYKYRDEVIAEMLGVDASLFQSLNRKERNKKYYEEKRQKQILSGEDKKTEIFHRRAEIHRMILDGQTMTQIANRLGVCLSTVKKDAAYIKMHENEFVIPAVEENALLEEAKKTENIVILPQENSVSASSLLQNYEGEPSCFITTKPGDKIDIYIQVEKNYTMPDINQIESWEDEWGIHEDDDIPIQSTMPMDLYTWGLKHCKENNVCDFG